MRRILLPPLLALLLLGSLLAAPRAATAAATEPEPGSGSAEAVVLTGAHFPAWVADDADVAADRLLGYRYDGEELVRVPLRVHLVEDGEPKGRSGRSSGADDGWCEDEASGGPAGVRELRAEDFVVLAAEDAGAALPADAAFPAGVADPHEVVLRDREGDAHLYVALAGEEPDGKAHDRDGGAAEGGEETETGTCVTTASLEEEDSDAEVTRWRAEDGTPSADDDTDGDRGDGDRGDGGDGHGGDGDRGDGGDGGQGGGRDVPGDGGQDGTGDGGDQTDEARSEAERTSAGDDGTAESQEDDAPARATAASSGPADRDVRERAAAPAVPGPARQPTATADRGEGEDAAGRPAGHGRSTGSSADGPVRRVAIGGRQAHPDGDEADEGADRPDAESRPVVPPTRDDAGPADEDDDAMAPFAAGRPELSAASEPLAVHPAGPLVMALAALGGSLGGVLLLAGLLVLLGHTLRRRLVARI